MNWYFVALLGYLLYSLVTVANKFLLRQRATTKPLVFTFWISLFSVFTFLLAPFGLNWPGWSWLFFDLLTGLVFFISLLSFYQALDINEASRSSSVAGGLIPIFVLFFSSIFLGETLGWFQLLAFILLVIGGFLISLEQGKLGFHEGLRGQKFIALTVTFHAVYFVMLKYLFEHQDFITGFVWSRLGLVVAALFILIYPSWRKMISLSAREVTGGISSLMLGSKLAAGFGSLFISLAVFKGSVSLVNALKGSEYVFLFLITILLSRKFPAILREKLNGAIILQKTIAIIFICLGLALIVF